MTLTQSTADPRNCKTFSPRYGPFGKEMHQCLECGQPMSVCENCSGDYHELAEHRRNCPSKRLNNTVEEQP